jgi:4-hydroxy-2-oxoheptanedioate aldolase
MSAMKKHLKERIKSGERLFGSFVMVPSPSVVEMLGYAGFDFVVLDTEHGSATVETLENQLRAAEATGIAALVRTVGMTPGEILRVLDAGAQGIVVPHVRTPQDARAIVAAAHYAPKGIRGIATTGRAGHHGFVTVADHLAAANERILVIPQIEDADALAHVREIAGTEGVDAIFIGPADLSMSLGHPGNPDHPDVKQAIVKAVADIRSAGSVPMSFARTPQDVTVMQQRDIHVSVFSTTTLFSAVLRDTARSVKEILTGG